MIKVSKLTDYAVILLSVMSVEERMSASDVAKAAHLPEPTVSKILKLLAKAGVLISARGAFGGYVLSRSEQEISIADIVSAIDGPIALTACVSGNEHDCDLSKMCSMNGRWNNVNAAVIDALQNVSLGEMSGK